MSWFLCPVCNEFVIYGKHKVGGSKCLESLGTEAQRVALALLPFWKAIALRHNGFNPEVRADLGLEEPTPHAAVDELMEEAVALHVSEVEMRIRDILNDPDNALQNLRALAEEEGWIV